MAVIPVTVAVEMTTAAVDKEATVVAVTVVVAAAVVAEVGKQTYSRVPINWTFFAPNLWEDLDFLAYL